MTADVFAPVDSFNLVTVDDKEFDEYVVSGKGGIALMPERYSESTGIVMKSDGGAFAKWIKNTAPQISVVLGEADRKLDLRSDDLWLPLAYIGSDVTLQIYLNLVSSYIYDRLKGALRGEEPRVHFRVRYRDQEMTKELEFSGPADALDKAIKKIDVNKFVDK